MSEIRVVTGVSADLDDINGGKPDQLRGIESSPVTDWGWLGETRLGAKGGHGELNLLEGRD